MPTHWTRGTFDSDDEHTWSTSSHTCVSVDLVKKGGWPDRHGTDVTEHAIWTVVKKAADRMSTEQTLAGQLLIRERNTVDDKVDRMLNKSVQHAEQ